MIAVTRRGKRFTNEADSYHDYMRSLLAATPAGEPVEAWLVCDHRFIRRYGLGAVKPAPMPLGNLLANGHLEQAQCWTLALTRVRRMDSKALQTTVLRATTCRLGVWTKISPKGKPLTTESRAMHLPVYPTPAWRRLNAARSTP